MEVVLRPKNLDVLAIVKKSFQEGHYIYSQHAHDRQLEREVSDGDVRHAILNRWHEKKKDSWIEEFQSWNYAIRGSSLDGSPLRIAVSIDEVHDLGVIIITVITLKK